MTQPMVEKAMTKSSEMEATMTFMVKQAMTSSMAVLEMMNSMVAPAMISCPVELLLVLTNKTYSKAELATTPCTEAM